MESPLASNERLLFQERLAEALEAAGCDSRPTVFAREFNLRADGAAVTVHAARKWLRGESLPTQERLHVLARWLNVSPHWLRFGEGDSAAGQVPLATNDAFSLPQNELVVLSDFRRLHPRSQEVVRDVIRSLLTHHSLRK